MTLIDAKELLEYIEGIPPLDSSLLRRAIINHIEETAFAEGAGALAYEKVFEEAYSSHIAKGADAYEAALLAHTDTKRERKNLIAQHKVIEAYESESGVGWQDISSAPHDGTPFLAFAPLDLESQWYLHEQNRYAVCYYSCSDTLCEMVTGFIFGKETEGEQEEFKPTHWMPLPAPHSQRD